MIHTTVEKQTEIESLKDKVKFLRDELKNKIRDRKNESKNISMNDYLKRKE